LKSRNFHAILKKTDEETHEDRNHRSKNLPTPGSNACTGFWTRATSTGSTTGALRAKTEGFDLSWFTSYTRRSPLIPDIPGLGIPLP
jgi:hypothetical protein